MNVKKLISRFMLAGLLLTQVPQVLCMEQNNGQEPEMPVVQDVITVRNTPRDMQHHNRRLLLKRAFIAAMTAVTTLEFLSLFKVSLRQPSLLGSMLQGMVSVGGLVLEGWILRDLIVSSRNRTGSELDLSPLITNIAGSLQHTLSKVRTTNSNIDQRGEEGDTLLMRCAKVADYVGVQKCIMHGASLDLIDQHGNNAFKYAIEADSEESVRILLVARADKQRAGEYLAREIADYVREISEIEAFQVIHGAIPQILNLVEIKRKGLEALQKMQILFSQTPVQLLAPLTPAQKLEYKKMFVQREQVKPSLDGSLMLYEDFDDATALKKYLKERASIATRLSGKMPTALYTHVMSFLRKKSDEKEQRLEQALRKAIICKDEELSQLLVKNGVELDIDEKIAAQFN